ncbi:MAG TPA: RNA methyltransferase [Ignavibacteriaceae bacterium]|nr:RNA methyltransferase [Ignavibacteriaceae bacterium]
MLSKKELKYYSSLRLKKFRDEENKFIAEGKKIVEEGLSSKLKPEIIFCTKEFIEKEERFFDSINRNIRKEVLSEKDFQKISDTVSPQGIAGVFAKPNDHSDVQVINENIIVCLDNISDPGNLGTIIRNCDWFGIRSIILTINCADIYNSKTIRASMGSVFHLKFFNKIKFNQIKKLKEKEYQFICTDIRGEDIYSTSISQKTLITFSNEANGPSKEILNLADKRITIPGKGKAESLNVASASAVILSYLARE